MGRNSGLGAIVAKEIRVVEAAKTKEELPEDIYDVYRRCSPELMPPKHLGPYCDLLTKACLEGDVEAVVHAPPQHGKTLAAAHAFILFAMGRPGFRHAYSTYSADRSKEVMILTKALAFAAGLDPHTRDGILELSGGTKVKFGGASTGTLTGWPIDGLHVIDDPIKDRKEAMSKTTREDRWQWFHDVAQTRRHPGSSCLVMMTRWASDDLSGRIVRHMGWDYICLALVCESPDDPLGREIGEVLWPEMRPEEWIEKMELRKQPLTWSSMYQGRPRPLGDTLFGEPVWYDNLPTEGAYRIIYGCDLAYTETTRSDWSVLLKARMYLETGQLFLTKMWREQKQADKFTKIMRAAVEHERGHVMWHGSTTERGVAQLIRQQIPTFRFRQATTDKYVRAIPCAENLWNPGRILVPTRTSWAEDFCHEVLEFTGEDDPQDDQVDALSSLGVLAIQHMGLVRTKGINEEIRVRMRGQLRR